VEGKTREYAGCLKNSVNFLAPLHAFECESGSFRRLMIDTGKC